MFTVNEVLAIAAISATLGTMIGVFATLLTHGSDKETRCHYHPSNAILPPDSIVYQKISHITDKMDGI